MAILFDDGSTEYLKRDAGVRDVRPTTMACWFNSNDTTVDQVLMGEGMSALNRYWGLMAAGTWTGDPVVLQEKCGAAVVRIAKSTSAYTANKWYHVCGIFVGTSERTVYLDGGSKNTRADASDTVDTWNRTSIGCSYKAGVANLPMSGLVANAAIWNVALTDEQVAALAAGAHPFMVRPDAIVAYWPLYTIGHLTDIISGSDMTAFNTPATSADGPPITYPGHAFIVPCTAAAGGALALSGTVAIVSSLTAALDLAAELAGTVGATAAIAGDVDVDAALAGAAGGIASVAGSADISATLIGSLTGIAALVGDAKADETLAGALAAASSFVGSIAYLKTLAGSLAAASSLAGNATALHGLAGGVVAVGTFAGATTAAQTLAGLLAGNTSLIGNLGTDAPEDLPGPAWFSPESRIMYI